MNAADGGDLFSIIFQVIHLCEYKPKLKLPACSSPGMLPSADTIVIDVTGDFLFIIEMSEWNKDLQTTYYSDRVNKI